MKIGQLIAYLILLSQFNLSSQKWIVHEIDRSNSSKMVQDCKGNILFIRGLTVVKYEDGIWSETQLESNNPSCQRLGLIKNEYGCEMLAFSIFGACGSVWPLHKEPYREVDIFPGGNYFTMAYSSDTNLYASNGPDFVKVDSLGSLTKIIDDDAPFAVMRIYVSHDNDFWIQGADSNFNWDLFSFIDGVWTEFPDKDGDMYFFYKDSADNAWFVNRDQLIKYDGTNWITELTLPNVNNITDVYIDKDENMWIATNFNGVAYWDKQELTWYRTSNSELHSNNCYSIELVDEKTLWVAHDEYLTEVRLEENSSAVLNTNGPQFSLYPNPSQGCFTLSFPHEEKRKIEIFDLSGNLINSTITESRNVIHDLESKTSNSLTEWCLPTGQAGYWVRVSGAAGTAVKKVIVTGH